MRISEIYKSSKTKKLIEFFFYPNFSVPFCDSKAITFIKKIKRPLFAEILLLVSIICFWYEGFFAKIVKIDSSLLGSVLLVTAFLFIDKTKVTIKKPQLYLICFYVLFTISGLLAVTRGIEIKLIILGWILFFHFLLAIIVTQGVKIPTRLLKNMVYISLPMVIVGAYQYLTNQQTSRLWVSPSETEITTRAFAFFGSPNVLGAVLALMACLTLAFFIKEKSKNMGLIFILIVLVVGFTFSRSAWIGLFAGLLIMLLVYKKKLIIYSPIVLILFFIEKFRERIMVAFSSTYWFDSSLDGRIWSITNGLHLLEKYPMLGTGPGTYGGKLALNHASPVYLEGIQNGFVPLYFTDNQWLEILVQSGIFGSVFIVLFMLSMLYYLIYRYNKTREILCLGMLGAFVSFLLAGIFGNVLEFGAIAVPMGIILGASFDEKK